MTFSICVRERYTDERGSNQMRFGVAVTTRLPGVGTLCPFASKNGVVATQSLVNVELGRNGVEYLDDGLGIEDALQALLNADEGQPQRQVHGVDSEETFAFSGDECKPWYGHVEGANFTVAGNLLTGEEVVTETAAVYESDAFGERPLAERLIEALEAGHEKGGDKREEFPIHSAALIVKTTRSSEMGDPYYDDLRVDATKTPITDLQDTYEHAVQGWEDAVAQYSDTVDEADTTTGE